MESGARLLSTMAWDLAFLFPRLRVGWFSTLLVERRRQIHQASLAVAMEAMVCVVTTLEVGYLVKPLGVRIGITKSEVTLTCADLDGESASFRKRSSAGAIYRYLL